MRKLVSAVSRLVAVSALVAACGTGSDDDAATQRVRDGTDLVSHEGDTELLTAALVGTSGAQLSLATVIDDGVGTKDIGDGARAFFFPRGCVVPRHDSVARTVTYTFTDCAGPFGLRRLGGTVTIGYARRDADLDLTIVARALAIGRATVDLDATATVHAEGSTRTATWRSALSGKTARDRTFVRTVERTLVFSAGESCIEASGVSRGDVGGAPLTVTIDRVRRCRAACPEAGGKVTIEGAGATVELAFDGTTEASLTIEGKARTIALACAR